jgi:hypothetical protein
MRKVLLFAAIFIPPYAANAQDSDNEWLENCRDGRFNGRRETACSVNVKTIPARTLLTIRPGQNGAVHIIADDRRDIEVHTRLQATSESDSDATAILKELDVDLGSTITVHGPASGRSRNWSASFVIFVPRNTDIDATTQNGPIGITNVFGKMHLSAQNGPISLDGAGGQVHARAQNGPLHVTLTGTRWNGAGLDAETQNGPVDLEIPADYNAALETGTVNGPMASDFPMTVTLNGRDWKRLRTTLGSGGPAVRVVTTNGPVSLSRP